MSAETKSARTMRALVLRRHGSRDDLELVEDYPAPQPVDGHVVIRVDMATPPSETSSSPSLLQLVVKDSGVGIPSENLARVFQPFYRGAQRDFESSGTGLTFHCGKVGRCDGWDNFNQKH